MSEIKLGSIVKVKTGCVEMTIVRLFNDGESECADCVWSEYDEERGLRSAQVDTPWLL